MTDRELLRYAAKASGIVIRRWMDDGRAEVVGNGHYGVSGWNPLSDDGDALRLAVNLHLQVTPGTYRSDEASAFHAGCGEANERVHYQQGMAAATRRAIVRAAAEIGRAMP